MPERPVFTWDNGICEASAVKFSNSADFSQSITFRVDGASGQWQAAPDQWARVRKLGSDGSPVYWKLVGVDVFGNDTSGQVNSFSFIVNEKQAELIKQNGLWDWVKNLIAQISTEAEEPIG